MLDAGKGLNSEQLGSDGQGLIVGTRQNPAGFFSA